MPDSDTMLHATWLMLHDTEFIRRHRSVDPKAWPLGPMRYLIALSLKNFDKHATPLTAAVVDLELESDSTQLRRNRTEAAMVRRVFRDLDFCAVEPDGLPAAREYSSAWVQRRSMLTKISGAEAALDRGELAAAEELLRVPAPVDDRSEPLTRDDAAFAIAAGLHTSRKGSIPTGFYDLDRAWGGGIRKAELGILAATTGVGKSQMLAAFAGESFWAGKHSLTYTFELTKEQMLERITLACLQSGKYDLDINNLPAAWAREARNRRVERFKGNYTVREGASTWSQIEADVEDYKRDNGKYPDLLCLDSADDITSPGKYDAEWMALKASYRHMRTWAQEKKIAVWTTSQLKQEAVEKARVNLRHIGSAFAKAQLVHYVLGMAQTPEEKGDPGGPILNIYVLKDSLHGTTGGWLRCRATFGDGENGYPGAELMEARGLPLINRSGFE